MGLHMVGSAALDTYCHAMSLLAQVVHPRYLEALRIGAEAVEAAEASVKSKRPLPYLFGSPEYLQVTPQPMASNLHLQLRFLCGLRDFPISQLLYVPRNNVTYNSQAWR